MTEEIIGKAKGLGGRVLAASVDELVHMGYPRLALSRRRGDPWQPYIFNVRATFDTPDVNDIPDQGADSKITTDLVVDAMVVLVSNDNAPLNVFQPQADYFTNYQSGIEATLEVMGTPRYSVAPNFTPLKTLCELINPAMWPQGWVLTYQEQVKMDFFARVALANFPTTVVVTFRGWTPVGERYQAMPNDRAIEELRAMGVDIPEGYKVKGY
jgi:hypothetical protein